MTTHSKPLLNEYQPPEPAANNKEYRLVEQQDWRAQYMQDQERNKQKKGNTSCEQNNASRQSGRKEDKTTTPTTTHGGREENLSDISWFAGGSVPLKQHSSSQQTLLLPASTSTKTTSTTKTLLPPPGAPKSAELHYRVEPQTLDDKETAEGAKAISTFLKQRNLITSSDSGEDKQFPTGLPVSLHAARTANSALLQNVATKNVSRVHKPPFRVQPSDIDPFGDAEEALKGTPLSPVTVPTTTNSLENLHCYNNDTDSHNIVNSGQTNRKEIGENVAASVPVSSLHQQKQQQQGNKVHNNYVGYGQYQAHPQPAVILIPSSLMDSISQSNTVSPYHHNALTYASQDQTTHPYNRYFFGKKEEQSGTETGIAETTTTVGDETLTFSRGATSSTMPLPFEYPNDEEDDSTNRNSSSKKNCKQQDRQQQQQQQQQQSTRLLLRHTTDTIERSKQGSVRRRLPKTTQHYNKLFWQRKKLTLEEEDEQNDNDDSNNLNDVDLDMRTSVNRLSDNYRANKPQKKNNIRQKKMDIGSKTKDKVPTNNDRSSNAAVSEHSGMESTKMHILANPRLLLNVFTFWINLLACHGTSSHNACVHSVLSDLNDHFERLVNKKRMRQRVVSSTLSVTEEKKIARASEKTQRVLDELFENMQDRSYDTTHAIVNVVNAVGPYVLRSFLVETQVISLDPYTSDTASAWAHVIAASDPTLPYASERKLTDPSEMLRRMAWSKNLTIPGL